MFINNNAKFYKIMTNKNIMEFFNLLFKIEISIYIPIKTLIFHQKMFLARLSQEKLICKMIKKCKLSDPETYISEDLFDKQFSD